MIREENLNKLYLEFIENGNMATKTLNALGFNGKDLSDLIVEGTLIRLRRGLYALNDASEVYRFGKNLLAKGEYAKAMKCFARCLEIDPFNKIASFYLFVNCVKNKDYPKAFEYLDGFYNINNKSYQTESSFYLYMLSLITEVPKEYQEISKKLTFKDIKIALGDKRYENIKIQNQIRWYIFNNKLADAMKLLMASNNNKDQDTLTRELITQALATQQNNKKIIMNLIMQDDYDKIVEILERQEEYRNLSVSTKYALKLAKNLVDVRDNGTIPKCIQIYTDKVFEAIDMNNFELALALEKNRLRTNTYSMDGNYIYLLLEKLVTKIRAINTTPVIIPEDMQEDIDTLTFNYDDIVKYLKEKDFNKAFVALNNYLISINKSEYEFLIVNLIKASTLKKDPSFEEVLTCLTDIANASFSFTVGHYVQEFYRALVSENFPLAKVYLEIISKGNYLGQEFTITDGLYQVLAMSEKDYNFKKEFVIDSKVDDTNETNDTLDDYEVDLEEEEEEPKEVIEDNKEEALVKSCYQQLMNEQGIILLEPMSEEEIYKILEEVKKYENIAALVIGNNEERRVVLKYSLILKDYFNVSNAIELANKAYRLGSYDECIRYNLQLLRFFRTPRSNIFSKLGLCYMKKKSINLAITYLTVANIMAKDENLGYDYTDLIARLKGKEDATYGGIHKKYFNVGIDEFTSDNKYYGINNFEKINDYIITSTLDVDSACEELKLSKEITDIIKLIYAREFYIAGNMAYGDLFLKAYEMSKYKTLRTKKIFEEIRKNKKLYQNRQSDEQIKLALSLVPRKN